MAENDVQTSSVGKTALKLSVVAAGMFAFVFVVMVPLYNVFCEITGLNGKGADSATTVKATQVDEGRTVRVTFVTAKNEQMPWDFTANEPVMEVKPGQTVTTSFHVKNTTGRDMVSRAVPSFVPATAGRYFHKVQCFCFDNQPLAAGESTDMGLQFFVDPELPKNISNITLSYTIFDITEAASNQVSQR